MSSKGYAFIDRRLYLRKDWTGNPEDRLAKPHVPEDMRFATKPAIAAAMVRRAIDAGGPFAWVAADSVMASVNWRWCCAVPAKTTGLA
ncbi:transposase [Azospirillum sp. TSH100]|nr:transposase [Azospirillum sp. TSH100]